MRVIEPGGMKGGRRRMSWPLSEKNAAGAKSDVPARNAESWMILTTVVQKDEVDQSEEVDGIAENPQLGIRSGFDAQVVEVPNESSLFRFSGTKAGFEMQGSDTILL